MKEKTSDAKVTTHHLPPADRCPLSLSAVAPLEKLPPFSFIAELDIIGNAYLLGQFRLAVPAVSPPDLLSTLSLLTAGRE